MPLLLPPAPAAPPLPSPAPPPYCCFLQQHLLPPPLQDPLGCFTPAGSISAALTVWLRFPCPHHTPAGKPETDDSLHNGHHVLPTTLPSMAPLIRLLHLLSPPSNFQFWCGTKHSPTEGTPFFGFNRQQRAKN
ncbi:hypothetical protein DAI22_12g114000 [Oryza sativa Japonica Group]|nr:hypothetical protein DAI22_12g114000 [Oryza sativa Japonica Group]KAF2907641.1 hypothetical protein DAI22_12g114000 [Oryza sativa Japonica Group]